MSTGDLQQRARQLGIATSYVDVDDVRRNASRAAVEAVVELLSTGAPRAAGERPIDEVVVVRGSRLRGGIARSLGGPVDIEIELEDGTALPPVRATRRNQAVAALTAPDLPIGIHRLHWSAAGAEHDSTLLVAPERFPVPERAHPGLALFAPAYSVWTRDEPLPAYDALGALGVATADLGVDTIATLPLYAPGLGDHFEASPYSPVSRFHWNEVLVPSRLLADAGGMPATNADRVAWPGVLAHRTAQLAAAVDAMSDADRADLDRFVGDRPDVASYAAFSARSDERRARLHEAGQWWAERALADVAAELAAHGQSLALDLPVGARADGWETHRWPELFMTSVSIGAPPDTFFAGGQNWGLPPLNPAASRRSGHRVWRELLAAACRFAGVLRVDHVMQVFRLWWVPAGHAAPDGVYVHYPADELLAVAAIVAEQTGTTIVGEDLGTVAPPLVELLADWGLVGMHEERFTVHEWAAPDPPDALPPVPPQSWAGVRTHDMPAFAAETADLDVEPYRDALESDIGHAVEPGPIALHAAILERLARSQAFEVVVDLDDALGETAAHNVPGTLSDTNWSRRAAVPVDELAADPDVRVTLRSAARKGA